MAKSTQVNAGKVSVGDFFSEAVKELKKVHRPTRQETVQASLVVIVMLFLFAAFLGLADMAIGRLMQWALS